MSNPNNVSDFPPLSGISPKSITSIAYSSKSDYVSQGTIWYGTSDGTVYISEKPSPFAPLSIISKIPTAITNFLVYSIYHFEKPKVAIVHWLGGSGQPGPVQIVYPGCIRNTISKEANRVVCYSSPSTSIFAIVSGLEVTVYEFISQIPIEKLKFQATGRIIAIEICEESICYYANNVYNQFYFSNEETVQLSQIPVDTPFVYCLTPTSFIIGYK